MYRRPALLSIQKIRARVRRTLADIIVNLSDAKPPEVGKYNLR
jgi:hypothetical protein